MSTFAHRTRLSALSLAALALTLTACGTQPAQDQTLDAPDTTPVPASTPSADAAEETAAEQSDDAATAAPAAEQSESSAPLATLEGLAVLDADFLAEGPASGKDMTPKNGRQGPFDGQVIPGFSAALDNGDGTFWAMPDNGFGNQQNSSDFLLRVYHVTPDWATAEGGSGEIQVNRHITLSDPNGLIEFPIVNEDTEERLLTGSDFDIESIVRMEDGTFWIGEEFGPYLLHVDAEGVLLKAPIELPDARPGGEGVLRAAENKNLAEGEEATVRTSKGFEAMAQDPRTGMLYPILEGGLPDEQDATVRWVFEFDPEAAEYTGRAWPYHADGDDVLVGDAFMNAEGVLFMLERDDFWGPEAEVKRIHRTALPEQSGQALEKELAVDLLDIADPAGISTAVLPEAYGVGEQFAFPAQSVEVVLELADGRLLVATDNNYPGNDARYTGEPDDTEMIVIELTEGQDAAGEDTEDDDAAATPSATATVSVPGDWK